MGTRWLCHRAELCDVAVVVCQRNFHHCGFGSAQLASVQIRSEMGAQYAEISTLYIMLAIASSVAGHDMMEILMPILPHAAWFASAENEWAELFHKYVPQWLTIKERSKLVDYYRGESTLYMWEHVSLWLTPVLWWTVFIVVLGSILLCFNLLLRKQWIEHEKLSYPII